MIVDTVLTNAKAYLKGEIVDCCIAIEDTKIFKIGKETHMPKADEKTNLHNLLVLPGVIDSHVHLRDEDNAYKETFFTGTQAAAAGGVTTVLDMPNNAPTTINADSLKTRMEKASRRVVVNTGFYCAFPKNPNEIKKILTQGAVGFKLFMAEKIGGLDITDDVALKEAFEQVAQSNAVVAVHAEDHQLLKAAVEKLRRQNRHDVAAFLKAHSEQVEAAAVDHVLKLTSPIPDFKLHICHLSTKPALQALSKAKASGKKITCEVTPHHLLLSKDAYANLGARVLTMPPLRSKENVDALWTAIAEGEVDTIGSDHAPHTLDEKDANSIWDIKAGVVGLETTLPLVLTLVHKNKLSLDTALRLLSEKPAEIFGLSGRGVLSEGGFADLVVVDFNEKYLIDASTFYSKTKFSPFDRWEVQGKPTKTYVNGQLVMDDHEIVAKAGSAPILRGDFA
ncbi:MAG: dihydroorotase family protein [Candidatus Bathyarchaeota archaeon]|nr:dihydroorotase family protein [Candidatus Bathyarchaeota archaeon]